MTLEYELRPLGPWLQPKTEPRRGAHLFKASWPDTLTMLGTELGYLDARRVVVQIDVIAGDIRRDGMLSARARVGFPGVRLSFESRVGPLTYATDAYERVYSWSSLDSWQANVRAIALGLQALRAVDRYGITRTGEQYRGWTAIADKPAEMSREQAAEFLAHWSGLGSNTALLSNPEALMAAYRAAATRAHPDAGGDADTFDRLTKARDLLLGGAHA